MSSSSPLELKISPFQIIFSLTMVVSAIILFLGRFLWAMWHSPRGFDAVSVVITLIMGGAITWWIYGGARRMWYETGIYLRVDEQEISIGTRTGSKTLRWDEIYSFTTDAKSTSGEGGYWLSLRGREDQVLAQWNRNWYRFTGRQTQRGDEIEQFIREKLRAAGRLKGEEKAATQQWQASYPISDGRTLQVQTTYGWVGWLALAFCLPCAFFSWQSPTGGPLVASGFLFFGGLGAYIISAAATLSVGEEQVEATSMYGRYRIAWSEVAEVRIDEQGNSLCLQGNNKRLCFTGPMYWKAAERQKVMLYLMATCEKRGIPLNTRSKPVLGGSKNAKV